MSTTVSSKLNMPPLDISSPQGVYNEVFSKPHAPRPHWHRLIDEFRQLTVAEFEERVRLASELLSEDGANYNVFGRDEADAPRPWDLDLIPFVVDSHEWHELESALDQRARLIDAVVRDLYGPRTLVESGVLPPDLIFAHPGYLRPCQQLRDPSESAVALYAAELARSNDGRWWVMADRLDSPAGPAYALENRIVSSHAYPQIMQRVGIQRLAPFFVRLLNALKKRSLRNVENPQIVLLSTGAQSPYYFEDVYLARYLGIDLVQGGDLAARDGRIYLKTVAGLSQVDVILNRGPERGIDPLALGGAAKHGVPGILEAIKLGNVVVANRPGSSLLESPVFMAFMPTICQTLFGEELQTPSIATWWCGDEAARATVFERLAELVIKPAFQASGGDEIICDRLSSTALEELRNRILQRPYNYVAQEKIARSAVPVWRDRGISCGHVALRTFLVGDEEDYSMIPGGLARIADTSAPMELSITAGSSSKDVWVMADGPIEPVTLLLPRDQPLQLKRSGAKFPSRTADDLFWLGQSLDRADFLIRLNRTVIERLTLESKTDHDDLFVILTALADLGQIASSYANLEPSMAFIEFEDQLQNILFDVQNPLGIANAVSELLRLAYLTRDLLSNDVWRKIHQSTNWYLSAPRRGIDELGEVHATLTQMAAHLAAVSGLFHDGMVRGPSWRFLDLGRRIECARVTAQFMLSLILSGNLMRKQVLTAILEVIDSRMTYRFRYYDNLQVNAVLDLAITDETNPRSVGYQLARLEEHLDRLPVPPSQPLRCEERRHLMPAIHAVRMLTDDALAGKNLKEVATALVTVDQQCKSLLDTLTRNYLVHSGPPRQITGE